MNFVGSHNVLQQEDPEYNDKRQKLYEYYHPLEFDPAIPLDEKTKLMEEWYVLWFCIARIGSRLVWCIAFWVIDKWNT